jgi:hypothetical protein
MPYTKESLRKDIEPELTSLLVIMDTYEYDDETLAKQLTYLTFKIIKHFYADGNWYKRGDVDKILESVKDEFHRRFDHPAEDKAMKENGDV